MMRTFFILAVLSLFAGCRRDDARRAHVMKRELAAATQTDLAREIDQAERRGTWREVSDRWQGQTLRWTVTRYQQLCKSEHACNVAPFPIQRPAQYGWMPGLSFAPGEFTKLAAACGSAERCDVTFEGTLRQLTLSAELPVSLQFDNVRIVGAHAS